jgi:hypothetical protein
MSWERGCSEIDRLIADGELERVEPSTDVGARLLTDANAHIALASKGIEDDPGGALHSATTPRASRPPRCCPCRVCEQLPEVATSRSSTRCERSSTIAAVLRSSVVSTRSADDATAPSTRTRHPLVSTQGTRVKRSKLPSPLLRPRND